MTSLRFAPHYDLLFCPLTQVSPNITIYLFGDQHPTINIHLVNITIIFWYPRFVLFLCSQHKENNRASCIPFWCPFY
jgi:hypothetical protein